MLDAGFRVECPRSINRVEKNKTKKQQKTKQKQKKHPHDCAKMPFEMNNLEIV